ncbi:MAG: UrcA family protein [Steroidobacteraceae bacterium]|nr:UrcA family protein [Steroidobacteraceae bacterium]
MKSFKLLPLAIALAMTGIAAAGTRVDTEVPSVVVEYGDLNLNTNAGVLKLHARLRSAAQNVCSPLDSRMIGRLGEYAACVTKAVTQSVAAVGNDSLSKYHRYGIKPAVLASN